jgi:hypothetical protein
MKKEWILVPLTCLTLLSTGWAEAQGASRIKRSGTHVRVSSHRVPSAARGRSSRVTPPRSISSARRPNSRNNAGLNATRGNANPRFGGLNATRSNASPRFEGLNRGVGSANGAGPLGGLLQQYLYNEYGGGRRYDPYAGEKAHAKAYRDAAIANAVVNVVGILATTHQQRQYGVNTTAPAPRGHVQRQRILVHEGRTEEYQVWVPQYRIPGTGEVVLGHNETRRREIAPVYEEREVWIPAP